jgi:hypothetical protein
VEAFEVDQAVELEVVVDEEVQTLEDDGTVLVAGALDEVHAGVVVELAD